MNDIFKTYNDYALKHRQLVVRYQRGGFFKAQDGAQMTTTSMASSEPSYAGEAEIISAFLKYKGVTPNPGDDFSTMDMSKFPEYPAFKTYFINRRKASGAPSDVDLQRQGEKGANNILRSMELRNQQSQVGANAAMENNKLADANRLTYLDNNSIGGGM